MSCRIAVYLPCCGGQNTGLAYPGSVTVVCVGLRSIAALVASGWGVANAEVPRCFATLPRLWFTGILLRPSTSVCQPVTIAVNPSLPFHHTFVLMQQGVAVPRLL